MKGISEESITISSRPDHSFVSEIIYNYGKGKVIFKGISLKHDSVSFIHENLVNLYISYKLDTWPRDLNLILH